MNDRSYYNLIRDVLCADFKNAEIIFNQLSEKDEERVIWSIAENYGVITYLFMVFLLRNRVDSFLRDLLFEILVIEFCYIEGGYHMAAYYMKKMVSNYPDNIV